MRLSVFTVGFAVFLCLLAHPICADMPQENSLEITKEKLLQSYRLSDEQTAHVFSAFVTIKSTTPGGRQGQRQYSRFSVDIEQHATGQRWRVWQHDFVYFAQITPQSFVFGEAEEGQLCLGLASDRRVYYTLIDLPSKKEREIPSMHPLGTLEIRDFMLLRIGLPGTMIQDISYTRSEGWTLTIQKRLLDNTWLTYGLQGIEKDHEVQWSITTFF